MHLLVCASSTFESGNENAAVITHVISLVKRLTATVAQGHVDVGFVVPHSCQTERSELSRRHVQLPSVNEIKQPSLKNPIANTLWDGLCCGGIEPTTYSLG